jgi:hypothetical protein
MPVFTTRRLSAQCYGASAKTYTLSSDINSKRDSILKRLNNMSGHVPKISLSFVILITFIPLNDSFPSPRRRRGLDEADRLHIGIVVIITEASFRCTSLIYFHLILFLMQM